MAETPMFDQEFLIALGESLADIKARLEVIEETIIKAGLISHDELVSQTEKKYDACNPIKMAMDDLHGSREESDDNTKANQ